MVSLYVVSPQSYSGKSLLCLILGARLIEEGKQVAYIKPIGFLPPTVTDVAADDDAVFINDYLGLKGPSELICPVSLTSQTVDGVIRGEIKDVDKKIKGAFGRMSAGKDVVLIGGTGSFSTGSILGLSSPRIAELLDTKVLLFVRYDSELAVEEIIFCEGFFRQRLVGTILNNIPKDEYAHVKETVIPYLENRRVSVFGAIPKDEILYSVSVREVVNCLGGQVLCCQDKLDELVERFMIGAMNVESALRYFRKASNKAVITGGDRPDIQLAALETSTKCVILSGNLYPTAVILARAQEMGVPMILVSEDTLSTVGRIERLLGRPKIRKEKKIQRAKELFSENIDFRRLYDALGI